MDTQHKWWHSMMAGVTLCDKGRTEVIQEDFQIKAQLLYSHFRWILERISLGTLPLDTSHAWQTGRTYCAWVKVRCVWVWETTSPNWVIEDHLGSLQEELEGVGFCWSHWSAVAEGLSSILVKENNILLQSGLKNSKCILSLTTEQQSSTCINSHSLPDK